MQEGMDAEQDPNPGVHIQEITNELRPVAKHWRKLGKEFGFAKEHLDAVCADHPPPFGSPETWLGSILEWKKRRVPGFGWKEIFEAVVSIGERHLANDIYAKRNMHIPGLERRLMCTSDPSDEIDEREVINVLSGDAHKWEQLGTQLGLKHNELKEIKMSNPQGDVKDWLLAMISRKKARTVGFGWNEIVEALRAIECNETADKICKQYKIPQPKSSAGEEVVMLRLIESSESNLKRKFASLVYFSVKELEKKRDVNFLDFQTYVIYCFSLGDHVLELTNYREVFNIIGHERKWDSMNYFPLLELLKEFIDHETEEKRHEYQEAVSAYYATRRLSETMSKNNLIEKHICEQADLPPTNYHEICIKLHPHRVTEKSLNYVQDLWASVSRYFSLPSVNTVLEHIPSRDAMADCVCATLPSQANEELRETMEGNEQCRERFMQANNIIEVAFDDGSIYSQEGLHSTPGLQVFVKTLYDPTLTLDMDKTDTIRTMKLKIEAERGVPVTKQRLVFAGRTLEDQKTLNYYGIEDQYSVYLVVSRSPSTQSIQRHMTERELNRVGHKRDTAMQENPQLQMGLRSTKQRSTEQSTQGMRNYEQETARRHRDETKNVEKRHSSLVNKRGAIHEARRESEQVKRQMESSFTSNRGNHGAMEEVGKQFGYSQVSVNTNRYNVQIMNVIGRGAWGTVCQGVYHGQPVVVNCADAIRQTSTTVTRLERETHEMALIRHPNIVHIIATVFDEQSSIFQAPPLILTEPMEINLRQCYEQGRLQRSRILPIILQVAYGLHHLHNLPNPIIHRDVSAPNIFLQDMSSQVWTTKIGHIGATNLFELSATYREGVMLFSAPETLSNVKGTSQTTKIDVYSFGILLCEVMCSQLPVTDRKYFSAMLDEVRLISPPLYSLIILCIQQNPVDRPSMANIIDELNKISLPH